jgi:hypothetical protein
MEIMAQARQGGKVIDAAIPADYDTLVSDQLLIATHDDKGTCQMAPLTYPGRDYDGAFKALRQCLVELEDNIAKANETYRDQAIPGWERRHKAIVQLVHEAHRDNRTPYGPETIEQLGRAKLQGEIYHIDLSLTRIERIISRIRASLPNEHGVRLAHSFIASPTPPAAEYWVVQNHCDRVDGKDIYEIYVDENVANQRHYMLLRRLIDVSGASLYYVKQI